MENKFFFQYLNYYFQKNYTQHTKSQKPSIDKFTPIKIIKNKMKQYKIQIIERISPLNLFYINPINIFFKLNFFDEFFNFKYNR